jgi:hypothetical protein
MWRRPPGARANGGQLEGQVAQVAQVGLVALV